MRVVNRVVAANTYLRRIDGSDDCLLIDPGLDIEGIETTLEAKGWKPAAIYCTHGHFDHIGSAEHFRRRFAVPVHLHSADLNIARTSNFRMLALKLPSRIEIPEVFDGLAEDASAMVGGTSVVHVPGHTPGSVVLRVGDDAFTGDTLYRSETWRMTWPEEDEPRLIASLRTLWDSIPDDTTIYPGHGGSADFGSIKHDNKPLRELLGLQA